MMAFELILIEIDDWNDRMMKMFSISLINKPPIFYQWSVQVMMMNSKKKLMLLFGCMMIILWMVINNMQKTNNLKDFNYNHKKG